jgi:hypothetical protein
LPYLRELLRCELRRADKSEVALASIVKAVAELGGEDSLRELVYLAEELNRDQVVGEENLDSYSEPHARRGVVLEAFATELNKRVKPEYPNKVLRPVGPAGFGMFAIEEKALEHWRSSATL